MIHILIFAMISCLSAAFLLVSNLLFVRIEIGGDFQPISVTPNALLLVNSLIFATISCLSALHPSVSPSQ